MPFFADFPPRPVRKILLDIFLASGTPTNLDLNPDLELGGTSTNGADKSGYVLIKSSAAPNHLFGMGSGTGPTEFLLGSTVWTATTASGTTSINFGIMPAITGNLVQKTVGSFISDGVGVTNAQYNNAGIASGSPVLISVPEPATLTVLSLGLLALGGRRRRRPC